MLKLTYARKRDQFQTVTVMGDPEGIRDLYWQLTHNYQAQDGTEIGEITVSDLDGNAISLMGTGGLMVQPHSHATRLSNLES